jgi:hypothetical protein
MPRIRNTKANRERAIRELGINVPYYSCRLVGDRLEFHLYGGRLVCWPPVLESLDDAPPDDQVHAGKHHTEEE